MPFNEQSLADARKQGYSDDQIYDHLSQSDQRFDEARKNGYKLDDVAKHLSQQQGGDSHEDNAKSQEGTTSKQDDEQGGVTVTGQVQTPDRVQPPDQSSTVQFGKERESFGQGAVEKPEGEGVPSSFSQGAKDFAIGTLSSMGQGIYKSLEGIYRQEPEFINVEGQKIKNPRFADQEKLMGFFEGQRKAEEQAPSDVGAKPLTGIAKTASDVTAGLLELPAQAFTGPIGFATMVAQGFGGQKEALYEKARQEGKSEEEAINDSNLKAGAMTAAALPLYWLGGKVAGAATDKLIADSAPKLAKVAARFGINAVANTLSSAVIRGVDASLTGENIGDALKDFSAAGVVQDIAFAAHSTAEHFQEEAKKGKGNDAIKGISDPILTQLVQDPRYKAIAEKEIQRRQEDSAAKQAAATGSPQTAKVVEEGGIVAPEGKEEPKPSTRIAAAAYRNPETGEVLGTGKNHMEAMENAGETPEEDPTKRETEHFGYTDEHGQFLTRDEAEQIAKGNGQFRGKQTDRPVMHSNEVHLDEHPIKSGKEEEPQKLPGAAAKSEFEDRDTALGAEIHKGNKDIGFDEWKKKFESQVNQFEEKKGGLAREKGETETEKYTEQELRGIYEKSKQVADISKTRNIPTAKAVDVHRSGTERRVITAIDRKSVDDQRQSMGLSRLFDIAKTTWKSVWDEAVNKISDDPLYLSSLLEKVKANPNHPLDQVDQAALHHELISIRHEYDSILEKLGSETDPAEIAALRSQLAKKEVEYQDLTHTLQLTGRANAQSLNMRKAMMGDDFSMLGMIRRKKAEIAGRDESKGGPALSEEEAKTIREQAKLIEDLTKQIEKNQQVSKGKIQGEELDQLREDWKAGMKRENPFFYKLYQEINKFKESAVDAAMARIKARRQEGRLNVGIDPVALADEAIVGAGHIVDGAKSLAEFSAKMIETLGEYVRPHLDDLFKKANEIAAEWAGTARKKLGIKEGVAKPRGKKVADMTPEEKIRRYASKLKDVKDDDGSIGTSIRLLAKAVYARGLEGGTDLNRNQLADAVHRIVSQEMGEGWTEGQTKDAITGYGAFKQLSKNAVDVGFRKITGELREIGKQADIRGGKAPKKTGQERAEKGIRERLEIKKNHELMKKLGIRASDPETQLAGAQDAIKNRLYNRIEELVRQIETGEKAPEKTPLADTPEIAGLRKEVEELKSIAETIYGKGERTPEQKIAAVEIAHEKLIKAKTEEMEREKQRILAGKKSTPAQKEKITSPKIETQKAELERLNQELKTVRDSDFIRKEEIKQSRIGARIEEVKRQMMDREVKRGGKKESTADTEETARLTKELADLTSQMKGEDWYIKNRQQLALQGYASRISKQMVDYKRRIEEKDFAPRNRTPKVIDPEIEKLKLQRDRIKSEFEQELIRDRWENRNWKERAADLAVAWKRFSVLSYTMTALKLGFASTEIALFKPITTLSGKVIEQIPGFRDIAKLAPSEGGGSISQDMKLYAKGFWSGAKEMKDIGLGQKDSALSVMHREQEGKAESKIPRGVLNMPGKMHEAIKNPTKRAVYEMSFQRHLNWLDKNGFDIHDEAVQQRASISAFQDANRSIFMEDNALVKFYSAALGMAKRSKSAGVRGLGYGAEELIPIVKIPTNIAKQVFEYAFGSAIGTGRMINALHKGLEKVSPEEADSIMRQMKNGSVGLTMIAIGAALPNVVGGFWNKEEKPGEDEPGFNEIKIDGKGGEWTKLLMHHPAMVCLQVGATMRKYWDRHIDEAEDGNDKLNLVGKSAWQAICGVTREIPFVSTMRQIGEYTTPDRFSETAGNIIRSNIPGFVQETAKWIDLDENGKQIKRSPENFLETIEQGLPFARQNIREK